MDQSKRAPIAVGASEGKCLSVMGSTYRLLVTGRQTAGAFAVMEFNVPPGGGPGPHSHADFYESFYVVEGEVEVKSEAGAYTAGKGAFVVVPKGGIVHQFKNRSDRAAVLLCTVVPAGLEDLFIEIGKPVGVGEWMPPPDMSDPAVRDGMIAATERHGQKAYPPDFLDNV